MSRISLKALINKGANKQIGLTGFTTALESQLQNFSYSTESASMALSIANESYTKDTGSQSQLEDSLSQLTTALESAIELGYGADGKGAYKQANYEAAVIAGALAGNVNGWINRPVVHALAQEAYTTVIGSLDTSLQGGMDERIKAFEAYDERENRNAALYSIAYNLNASRQNEFGEAFFPTITIAPDNVGYDISVRLIELFDGDLKRDISGAINDFKRNNLIRAQMDHKILQTNLTEITPVYRTETQAHFVPVATIAQRSVLVGRETVTTATLATKARFSLLGISSVPALIAGGLQDSSDAIDPAASLKNIYVKLAGAGADVIKFDVSSMMMNNFVASVQGTNRLMQLQFTNEELLVNKNTKKVDGTNLVTAADVVTDDVIVRLGVTMNGTIDLQSATTEVYGNRVSVNSVKGADGVALSLASGQGKDIADLFIGAEIIGYDLLAYRTNSNRRQRGDQLDTRYWTNRYTVPILAPISVARPVNADSSTDTSDLAALITTTQVRASNNAVSELFRLKGSLSQAVDGRDNTGEYPKIFGVGSHVVRATYVEDTLVMPAQLDSRTSAERTADMQALIRNVVRDMVYQMWIQSGFKAAMEQLYGAGAKNPKVTVGGDQELTRYMMLDGDTRTLGPDFEMNVVSTLDDRMKGQVFIAFTFDDAGSTPNPLNFGNMLWKPEATLVLPITRNGQISKELTVMPSFYHLINCPVLGHLTVSGLGEVATTKVPVATDII